MSLKARPGRSMENQSEAVRSLRRRLKKQSKEIQDMEMKFEGLLEDASESYESGRMRSKICGEFRNGGCTGKGG